MKYLRRMVFALLCAVLLSVSAFAAPAQVDSMQVALYVDQNGTARAEASIHVKMDEPKQTFSIALGPDVSGVHVEGFPAQVIHDEDQTTVELSSETGALPGTLELQLSYTIRNTVQSSNDMQHFSVRLLGGMKEADIQKLQVSVQMPAAFEAIPEFSSGYYAKGIDNYLTIDVNEEGLLNAVTTKPMLAGETLDVRLDTPLEYFSLQNVAGRTLTVDRIAMAVLALLAILYWWRSLRSALPIPTAQRQAPMGVEPGTAAMLVTGQTPDLALMVMSWAASGYLRITRLRGQKVMLQQLMPMGNERSSYEQAVFGRLFRERPATACGSHTWQVAQKKAEKLAPGYWNARLFEEKPGRPAVLRVLAVLFCGFAALSYADQVLPGMYQRVRLLIAFAALGLLWGAALQLALSRLPMRRRRGAIVCLLVCIALVIVAWRIAGYNSVLLLALAWSLLTQALLLFGPRRSPDGDRLLSELLGLRHSLRTLTQKDAQQLLRSDPQYYYRALLFAEALGVGRRFTQAFRGLKLDECTFLERENKSMPRTAERFYPMFRALLAIARGENVPRSQAKVSRKSPKRRPAAKPSR